ncbi:MAG: 23S rRNA (pseudouridine(1915)-N(3))-methyltransferase RlmH [Desulfobulbus oligotrophicus]|jgi:23S rRNA (pseudouridine1915-N3)-methyltransferase|nr:23S rRNA (pseudouridine(1915)-N(3))-methyltransferase RlmH [Desulfobulbus oligotrophicus]
MKLLIPLLGKTKESFLDSAIREYTIRLNRFLTVELPVLREQRRRKTTDETIRAAEAVQLLEQATTANFCIALDPKGISVTSEELAGMLNRWRHQGLGLICFFIGGYSGLHSSVLHRADQILSLSHLTFTHEMTRMILLEQLYRACTIIAGHNYHK